MKSDSGSSEEAASSSSSSDNEACAKVSFRTSGSGVAVVSSNVTMLTKARMVAVLQLAISSRAHVVALQETRHPPGGFKWAERLAADAGFRMQWSDDAGFDKVGGRLPGGTALLWKSTMAKSTKIECAGHRATGRRWGGFTAWSVYGPQSRADPNWLAEILNKGSSHGTKACIVIGDLNWKAAYEDIAVSPWVMAESDATIISGASKPSRALAAHASVVVTSMAELIGVPHHKALVAQYGLDTPEEEPQRRRLRRTALYSWTAKLLTSERTVLNARLEAKCPPYHGPRLDLAWQSWHQRAEEAFKIAADLELATVLTKAERSKGSKPSTRPVAPTAGHREESSILARRLDRLFRAAQEQICHGRGGDQISAKQKGQVDFSVSGAGPQ